MSERIRPWFFRLSHQTLFRRQRFTTLVIIFLALMIALPPVLFTTISNYLTAAEESKLNAFGAFTDIFYESDLPPEQAMDWAASASEQLPGFSYGEAGLLLTFKPADETDPSLDVMCGFVDTTARNLGRIQLIDGSWPDEPNELALTRTAVDKLQDAGFTAGAIGDAVDLYGRSYQISGIIGEYGRLWVRGQTQIENQFEFPELLFSEAAADTLLRQDAHPAFVNRTLIFVRSADGQVSQSFPRDQFFHNWNIDMGQENSTYGIPGFYRYVLLAAVFLVQILLLGIFYQQRKPVHRILRQLGVSGRRNAVLQGYELLLIMALSLTASIPLLIALSWLTYRLLTGLGGFTYAFEIKWVSSSTLLLLSALSGLLAALLVFLINQLREKRSKQHGHRTPRRTRSFRGLARQVRWDISQSPAAFIASVLVVLLLTGFFIVNAYYAAGYRDKAPNSADASGHFLPMDYDYELLIDGTRMGDSQFISDEEMEAVYVVSEQVEDPVLFFADQNGFGADQAFADRLAATEGIEQVECYRQISMAQVALKDGRDAWGEAVDGGSQESYRSDYWIYNEEDRAQFGIPDDTLSTTLYGFPENQLLQLADKVSEGEIDVDAIRRGDEVILVIPDIDYEEIEMDDGTTALAYTHPDEAGDDTLRYGAHQVGDTIDVYGFFSNERIWGQIEREDFSELVTPFHLEMKVGAIIRTPVLFDQPHGMPDEHGIILLNESFDALGIPARFSRIRAYCDPEADGPAVDQAVEALALENPVMPLNNLRRQMSDYRTYEIFLNFFLTLLNLMLFLVALTILIAVFSGKITRGRRSYILLRLNGLSLRRIGSIWLTENLAALLISAAIYLTLLISSYTLYIQQMTDMVYVISFAEHYKMKGLEWIYPWLAAAAALVLLVVVSLRQLRSFGLKPNRS